MKENLINHEAASDAKKIDLEDKLNLQKFTTQRDLTLTHPSLYIKDALVGRSLCNWKSQNEDASSQFKYWLCLNYLHMKHLPNTPCCIQSEICGLSHKHLFPKNSC